MNILMFPYTDQPVPKRIDTLEDLKHQARRMTKPSSIQTWMAPAGSGIGVFALAGYTLASLVALEGPFDLVRLLYANADTGNSWPIANIAIAPTAFINDGVNPKDPTGAAVTWTQVTSNNSGADGQYPSPSGSTVALTVPAAPSTGVLSWAATDWMQVSSFDPLDAGQPFPLLMTRTYSVGNQQGPGVVANAYQPPAIWPSISNGRIIRTFRQAAVNGVATPSLFNAPTEVNYLTPAAIQTYRRGRGYNIMALGDSLTSGVGTTMNENSWLMQAVNLISTPAMPVNPINAGWSGQTTAQFFSRGYTDLSLLKPDVVIIETMSPNDAATTQAQFNLMLARAMAFQDAVIRSGAIPVLKTAVPFYGYSSTTDAFRVAINNKLRTLASTGNILLLDADAAISDFATPQAHIATPYYDITSQHMNDAGASAIALALVSLLKQILS